MPSIAPFNAEARSSRADRLPWTALIIIAFAVIVVGWMVMTSTSATASGYQTVSERVAADGAKDSGRADPIAVPQSTAQ